MLYINEIQSDAYIMSILLNVNQTQLSFKTSGRKSYVYTDLSVVGFCLFTGVFQNIFFCKFYTFYTTAYYILNQSYETLKYIIV